jgi:hypothetical protein
MALTRSRSKTQRLVEQMTEVVQEAVAAVQVVSHVTKRMMTTMIFQSSGLGDSRRRVRKMIQLNHPRNGRNPYEFLRSGRFMTMTK